MELRHLRYFVAVAEEQHFTRAAERLHIAQPPLSRQIRDLELSLGVTLLHRSKRRIELSEAGRVFLDKARQILRAADAAVLETQRAQRGETGRLAIGFFEQIAYTLLPPILRAFQQHYPDLDIELRWFPVVDQASALERGDIDIGFVRPVADLSGLEKHMLLKEPFVLALPSDHPAARRRRIALSDCASDRVINYSASLAPDYHAAIIRACALAGFVPQTPLEVGQVYTALGLVSAGVGVAFVPESVQRLRFENVVYRPLRADSLHCEVYLAWKRHHTSTLLEPFRAIAAAVMQEQFRQ